MPKKPLTTAEEILEDAKKVDFDIVVVLGMRESGEAHLMYNVDEVSALQTLQLFANNLLAEILRSGGFSNGRSVH